MKKNLFALLSLVSAFSLMGCKPTASSSVTSSSSSAVSSAAASSSLVSSVSSVSESSSVTETNWVKTWVSDVASTANILIAGQSEGKNVDYVVSSYPVVLAAMGQNSRLSVKEDLAKSFGTKFGTDGFPQAGLFIKTSLEADTNAQSGIEGFLNAFDGAVTDLIAGGSKEIAAMNAFGDDNAQKTAFNFNSTVLAGCQKNSLNRLAFLDKTKNPDATGFAKFQDPLGITVSDSQLSSYYPTKHTISATESATTLSYAVTTPQGAPSAAFASFAGSTNLTMTAPANVGAAFTAGTADFIVFDTTNGLKLSAKNGNNYKLIRMVTFGNLYVVSTGNDANDTFEKTDNIVAYGENLVPGMAFKAVYGA
jgi:hypothetical protein